jgi:hypothetical protein
VGKALLYAALAEMGDIELAVALEQELREQFEDRGYVVLGSFLGSEIVEGVKAEIDKLVEYHAKLLLNQGRISDGFEDEPFETRMARLYEDHLDRAPDGMRRCHDKRQADGARNRADIFLVA